MSNDARSILWDDEPGLPLSMQPVQTLAQLVDYAERMAYEHPDAEDPDAVREMVQDAKDVVRQLQDFTFGMGRYSLEDEP